jgi:putative tryptophan/tyrosine transport system substrate-binding protein
LLLAEGHNKPCWLKAQSGNLQHHPLHNTCTTPVHHPNLVRRKVDVIAATGGEPSPQVAKAATQTIPIVFTSNGDPVGGGLVASLNRPVGNATGVTIFGASAVTKRLQLLHDLLPQVAVFGFLMNPNHPSSNAEMKVAETAARSIGKAMLVFSASSESEIEAAFANMAQQQVGALIGGSDTYLSQRREQIVSLAAHHRIPAIYYVRAFCLLDDLVGYCEHARWNCEAKRLGSLEINHEFELGRLQDW